MHYIVINMNNHLKGITKVFIAIDIRIMQKKVERIENCLLSLVHGGNPTATPVQVHY